MTDEDIRRQIGDAAVARRECFDRISCYEQRLNEALYDLSCDSLIGASTRCILTIRLCLILPAISERTREAPSMS